MAEPSAASRRGRYNIADVERETGIGKDTLRAWERRYGFPAPDRDAHGERVYTQSQVSRLLLIRQLIAHGYRPARIVNRHLRELERLLALRTRAPSRDSSGLDEIMAALKSHDVEALQRGLRQRLLSQGLERFVIDTVAPLNYQVGLGWAQGEVAVHEEHLYAQQVENTLRQALFLASHRRSRPRVLLTSMPGEQHRIGLLMAEVLFAAAGARCVPLGTETPVSDIALAAGAHRADIVALSFSAAYSSGTARNVLAELRAALPTSVELWAGGQGLRDVPAPVGVIILGGLDQLRPMLSAWRERHSPESNA